MFVFLNGAFVLKSDAKVSVFDLGFLRSLGAFEFARVYGGRIFCLDAHLDRFFASAKRLGIASPFGADELKDVAQKLIEKNGIVDGAVKFVLSGGEGDFSPMDKPTVAVFEADLREVCGPLKVKTSVYERILPECKTLNYMPAILAREEAIGLGFDEPLFLDRDGFVLEGARENFFAVIDGCVVTPQEGVLKGVTRQVVMDLVDVRKRKIHIEELKDCQGAFFTSTVREIAPICQIDEMTVAVHPLIEKLQLAFKDRVSQEEQSQMSQCRKCLSHPG